MKAKERNKKIDDAFAINKIQNARNLDDMTIIVACIKVLCKNIGAPIPYEGIKKGIAKKILSLKDDETMHFIFGRKA